MAFSPVMGHGARILYSPNVTLLYSQDFLSRRIQVHQSEANKKPVEVHIQSAITHFHLSPQPFDAWAAPLQSELVFDHRGAAKSKDLSGVYLLSHVCSENRRLHLPMPHAVSAHISAGSS